MRLKFALVIVIAMSLCDLLSSCSPGPISGEIFVTQDGADLTMGGVEVDMISAKDADDFMQQCQAQIDAKTRALNNAHENAKAACDAAARIELRNRTPAAKAELAQAQAKLNAATTALKNYPTANDYFAGFMPAPIETTVTDAEGAFTIDRPKQPAKVFAKAQRQTSGSAQTYFWLVDLPAAGGKLILNNDNLFKVRH